MYGRFEFARQMEGRASFSRSPTVFPHWPGAGSPSVRNAEFAPSVNALLGWPGAQLVYLRYRGGGGVRLLQIQEHGIP